MYIVPNHPAVLRRPAGGLDTSSRPRPACARIRKNASALHNRIWRPTPLPSASSGAA